MISDRIVDELLDAIAAPSLAGRIELGDEIGRGGMGVVYRATGAGDRPLAVKLMRRADRRDTERFAREAAVLEELEHPNIVGYVEHGVTGHGEAYLVMDWVDGDSLAARLRSGPLEIADAVAIARGLAAALAAAHERGVVHRDLKPSNVLVAGDPPRPVLLDFGVARRLDVDDQTLTATGEVVGTAGYLAPEQIEGAELDGRADLFALGCLLHEMLAGARAFPGDELIPVLVAGLTADPEPLEIARPEVPERLAGLVGALLAKRPELRPGSAVEVEAELAAIAGALERGDTAALATTRFERPRPRMFSRLALALVADAAIAAAVILAVALAVGDSLLGAIEDGAGPCDRDRYDGCELRCATGDAIACSRLGEHLAHSIGPARDRDRALPILERACRDGVGRACLSAATLLKLEGNGQDPRYLELARRGCDLGFGNACRRLGNLATEPADRLRWFRAGCDAGDAISCRRARGD